MTDLPFPVDRTAPCTTGDPDRWFPAPSVSGKALKPVLDECRACPFKDPCAEWALYHEDYGIWGATTVLQRRAARRRMGLVLDTPHARLDRHDCAGEGCATCRAMRLASQRRYEERRRFNATRRSA